MVTLQIQLIIFCLIDIKIENMSFNQIVWIQVLKESVLEITKMATHETLVDEKKFKKYTKF